MLPVVSPSSTSRPRRDRTLRRRFLPRPRDRATPALWCTGGWCPGAGSRSGKSARCPADRRSPRRGPRLVGIRREERAIGSRVVVRQHGNGVAAAVIQPPGTAATQVDQGILAGLVAAEHAHLEAHRTDEPARAARYARADRRPGPAAAEERAADLRQRRAEVRLAPGDRKAFVMRACDPRGRATSRPGRRGACSASAGLADRASWSERPAAPIAS